ncbi:MAG: hypothetical protein ACKO2Z_28750, partial [Sphaerospermopsis kisseleviana]
AQFLRYTLQKSCTFFPPDQPQTFDLPVFWVYSASPNYQLSTVNCQLITTLRVNAIPFPPQVKDNI